MGPVSLSCGVMRVLRRRGVVVVVGLVIAIIGCFADIFLPRNQITASVKSIYAYLYGTVAGAVNPAVLPLDLHVEWQRIHHLRCIPALIYPV